MEGEAGREERRPGPATARLMDDQPAAVAHDTRLRRLFVEFDARGFAGAPRRGAAARTALCSVESLDRLFFAAFKRSNARWIRRCRIDATVASGARLPAVRADSLWRDNAELAHVVRRRASLWR